MIILSFLLQTVFIIVVSTLIFDLCHYVLHRCLKSPYTWMQKIGRMHLAHHRFFSSKLKIEKSWQIENLYRHVFLEYGIQFLICGFCSIYISVYASLMALLFFTIIFIMVLKDGGIDPHHRPIDQLKPERRGLFVDANYHALHHVYPNNFYSSYVKIFDIIFGCATQLAGKKILMTGASGALGSNMKRLLEKEGAIVTALSYGKDYHYDDYSRFVPHLKETDILFLCHGTKYENTYDANCVSFITLIELYLKHFSQKRLLPEVWGVGSEIECHPCFGIKKLYPYAVSKRAFAQKARIYFHSNQLIYRHLVHAAFTSNMGRGLISAKVAAYMTLFFIKRGFKYVPVTYTGFAYINYLRYRFSVLKLKQG